MNASGQPCPVCLVIEGMRAAVAATPPGVVVSELEGATVSMLGLCLANDAKRLARFLCEQHGPLVDRVALLCLSAPGRVVSELIRVRR